MVKTITIFKSSNLFQEKANISNTPASIQITLSKNIQIYGSYLHTHSRHTYIQSKYVGLCTRNRQLLKRNTCKCIHYLFHRYSHHKTWHSQGERKCWWDIFTLSDWLTSNCEIWERKKNKLLPIQGTVRLWGGHSSTPMAITLCNIVNWQL